jgi:hypothetical protein
MTRWEGKPITEGEMDILLWVIVAIIMLAVVYGSFGQKKLKRRKAEGVANLPRR